MSVKYYIRPRAEENAKLWQGPFDVDKLKELADRRLFSKELHEYSEDRLNWISARQLWPTMFPKTARSLVAGLPVSPVRATSDTDTVPFTTTSKAPQKHKGAVEEAGDWYCAIDGVQQGPFTLAQVQAYVADSRLQPNDLVWCPAFGEQWVEARTIPELTQSRSRVASTAEQVDPSGKAPPLAVVSLICGVLGLTCLFGLGGLLAIILGHIALSQSVRSQSANGRTMSAIGLGLGYGSLALLLVVAGVFMALRLR